MNTLTPSFREEGVFIGYIVKILTFLTTFFSLVFFSSFSYSAIVQIKFRGTHYVKESDIRKVISIKPGDVLNEDKIREDLQAIYDMGYFLTVRALKEDTEKGTVLIYQVEENPVVTGIKFVGVSSSEVKRLKEIVSLEIKKPWNFKKAQESKEKILEYLKKKGYTQAKVNFSTPPLKKESCVAIFNVEKGQRARIMEVEIIGNQFFSDSKLRSFMQTRFKKYLDPQILDKDMDKIIQKYKEQGFYFAHFKDSPQFEFFEKYRTRWVRIFLKIEEGKRYIMGDIRIKGNKVFSDKELKEQFRPAKGEIFNITKFKKSIQRINNLYGSKGYLFAVVENKLHFNQEKDTVNVVLSIKENGQVRVGDIKVEGNKTTKWRVFKHTILLKYGDVFDVSKIRESWRRLYNLGFFETVEMEPLYTSDPLILDLLIKVKEREKTGKLLLGASYNSNSGLEGFIQLSKDNLWGEGKAVNIDWEFGEKRNNYQIQYVDRWWKDTSTRLELSVYNKAYQFYDTEEGYMKKRSGVELVLGRPWFSNLSVTLSLKTEKTEISSLADRSLPPELEEGEKAYQSLKPSLIWDSRVRDEVFNSYKGFYGIVSVTKSGGFLGGDVDFTKFSTELRAYLRQGNFWRLPILALRIRYRWGEDLPLDEEFYVGGQDTLRGYEQNEFRSSRVLLGSMEFRMPLTENSLAYLFADAGKIWDSSSMDEYKVGYGFGLKFNLPIGIIRLDYGIGENEEPQIYFGMGDVF